MRYRRKRTIHSRRITEAQRSATEEAYLNSLRQQRQAVRPPIYIPVPSVHVKKKISLGSILLIVALLLLIVGIIGSFSRSPSNLPSTDPDPGLYSVPTTHATVSFCSNQPCIPNFPNGNGSIIECRDGTYSHSGGKRGVCSHHGGKYP